MSLATQPNSTNLDALKLQLPKAPLSQIADIIRKDWKNPHFAAVPYIRAMLQLRSIDSQYGADDGHSIVLYFLCNARTWRGEVATMVKRELKNRAGVK